MKEGLWIQNIINLFHRRQSLQSRWWWGWWPRSRWTPACSSPLCAWRWRLAGPRRWGTRTGWRSAWIWRGSSSGWLSTSDGRQENRWYGELVISTGSTQQEAWRVQGDGLVWSKWTCGPFPTAQHPTGFLFFFTLGWVTSFDLLPGIQSLFSNISNVSLPSSCGTAFAVRWHAHPSRGRGGKWRDSYRMCCKT